MSDLSSYGRPAADAPADAPPAAAVPAAPEVPHGTPDPPRRPSGGGLLDLWRQANSRVKVGVLVLVLLVVAATAFAVGRGGGEDPAPKEDREAVAAAKTLVAIAGVDQSAKAADSEAKSNARNVVTYVESCAADTGDYSQCHTAQELSGHSGATGMPLSDEDPDGGEVAVTEATATSYRVVAESESGNRFAITKAGTVSDTTWIRSCSANGAPDGGCRGGTW